MGQCVSRKEKVESVANVIITIEENSQVTTSSRKDEIFKQPGVCNIVRTNNLAQDLKELQRIYQSYKPLIPRKIKVKENDKTNSLTIMQFNMLADGLTGAYTLKETDKTFLGVDKSCLEFTYRGLRLVEEMTRFDPDIICIEECDSLNFFMEYLEPRGYLCEFQEKTSSPIKEVIEEIAEERNGEKLKMPNDGVAIIYKTDKFEIIGDIEKIDMKENKEKVFALAIPFRCKQTKSDAEFLIVCTHLKSTKAKEGEELRERQINLLFSELIKNEKNLPIIFCADLNANPITNKKGGYEPLCYNALTSNIGLGFRSCYKIALDQEPEYTTWKARADGVDKHVLDYIFINNDKLDVVEYLEIPQGSKETKALIPNWDYPSDHFSIMCKLAWD